ncbi:MAG: M23 family metallopeptidase, partial [Mariprofundaceae bacterium]
HAWPTEGGWLSSNYGRRTDPFTGQPANHYGVDIANRFAAPVLSASRGVVTFAGKMKDVGYMVDVDHGYGYKTRYGHMSSLAVKVGDVVDDSQLLGRIGSSGRSTGPHLHFEVHLHGKHINPATFLPRG